MFPHSRLQGVAAAPITACCLLSKVKEARLRRTSVRPLDKEALVRILTEPKNALVRQYGKLFELDNVGLEFSDDALEAIADQAILRGTGARGLRAILEEVLLSVMYDVPSRKDVAKVLINAEVVLEHVNPTLVPRDATPPKRERREKSA